MNKNISFIIVLAICIISLILGTIKVAPSKNPPNIEKPKTKIDKIMPKGDNRVAVINIEGVISSSSSTNFFEEDSPAMTALESIKRAEEDASVKGIMLCINSPGGTVGMSQRLYNAIMKARDKKPVIAVMSDVAASGGYYVASAADRIVALPGTMTGSIGVIMSTMDYHRLLNEKLSVSENVIKSGKFKDMGSGSRAMTAEERALLQDMVNDSYSQFKDAIIRGRIERKDNYDTEKTDLTLNNLNKYADGRVFTGNQALKYGFVDSTGGMDSAKEMMTKMAVKKFNLPEDTKLNYDTDFSKTSNFLKLFNIQSKTNVLDEVLPQSMKYSKKPLYLWE